METVICMLIWPQPSLPKWDDEALMRRTAAATTWDLSNSFLEQDTVDGGELEMALGTYDEPWEDQSWEEPEESENLAVNLDWRL